MAQKEFLEYRQKDSVGRQWAMPREQSDLVREYQATHEDNFLSGWLRDDTEGKAEPKTWRKQERELKKKRVERGGEMERVAADCKRACCGSRSSFSGRVCERSSMRMWWKCQEMSVRVGVK